MGPNAEMETSVGPGRAAPSIVHRIAASGLPALPRLAWLEVDLDVLAANARAMRTLVGPAARLGIVVKADGYGHGIEGASVGAVRGGADVLIVASLDEARAVRAAGIEARLLCLYPIPAGMVAEAVGLEMDVVAMDEGSLNAIITAAARTGDAGPPVRVHLGVDTGMSRGGFAASDALRAARRLASAGGAVQVGTWSHLHSPEDAAAVRRQAARLAAVVEMLRSAGIDPGARSIAATGGILADPDLALDLARIGLAFYGHVPGDVVPDPRAAAALGSLAPALSLRARAASITTVAAGETVGYGGEWRADRDARIATLPLGYADGWVRGYWPGAFALVRGRRAPIVGRISSDALTVDVSALPGVGDSDEFVLLGRQGSEEVTAEELASLRGSITWEVLDAFGPRLSRVYVGAGRVEAVRHPGSSFRIAAPSD